MKQTAYWRRRAEQLEAARNKENKALIQDIAKAYDEALHKIDRALYAHLAKMAENNGLSLQKAAQSLTKGELAGYR
ncbi:MAG: hypothetical protein ACLT3C_06840, partial [Peptococcus niger]